MNRQIKLIDLIWATFLIGFMIEWAANYIVEGQAHFPWWMLCLNIAYIIYNYRLENETNQ